jgi:competence protein ComEC
MLSPRAPLFSVGLAFALGCVVGLDGWVALPSAFVALSAFGLLWLFLGRYEKVSLAAFYVFVTCAGLVHTLLVGSAIPENDLRRLPEEKILATTQWRGVVIEEPKTQLLARATRRSFDRTSFVLRVESWRPTQGRLFSADIDTPWQPARGDINCILLGPTQKLQYGDRIEFSTAIELIPPPLVPGELDFRAYEAEQGIYYQAPISALNWRRTETGGGNWWQNLSFRARDWAYDRLQIGLEDDPRMADFLAGMLIGYRQNIPADIEQDFRRTGTLHVFAVSGQNIAEMVVVAIILLQLCGLVRWRWAWTLAPIVLLYCLLTGSPASAVRATVMTLAILAAWRMGRPLNALGCWSLAFLAMLIWNPAILLDPGAQLSFGVVLGLILIAPPLMHFFIKPFTHDPFLPAALLTSAQKNEERFWWWIMSIFAASIAATLVSEPITAIDFHQVTPISILANLVVVPTAGLITMIGTLSVTLSLVATPLTALLNNANWLFARLLIMFVGFLAHHPGASINVPDLRSLSAPVPSFVVAPLQDSGCLLVRASDQAWLFNTGRENIARATTSHLLQFCGINQLGGLVLTQISGPDNGGVEAILRDFHPRHLITPLLLTHSPLEKMLPEMAVKTGANPESWQRGQSFVLAPEIWVEVLHPALDSPETRAEDRALVLLFHMGDQTLLYAGRIDAQTQEDILNAYPDLHTDVLVMAADVSLSDAWLKSLHVYHWLQLPAREKQLNWANASLTAQASCKIWPLNQTGAVDIHFQSAHDKQPASIVLRPWLALPGQSN